MNIEDNNSENNDESYLENDKELILKKDVNSSVIVKII